MQSNLCLGTAQFGMNYGVTNKNGQMTDRVINSIINKAIKEDIIYFDTANLYGDAEQIIGKKLKSKNAKISTKFKTNVKKIFREEDICFLESEFQKSLVKLKKKNVDSYLIHNCDDLKKQNSYLLINWLKDLKERGLIKRIGISIYEESDLIDISLKEIEVVQMPISIYDQRLLESNLLKKLLDKNISIHIRSIFLQGLLLQKACNWPAFMNESFLEHHKTYENEVYSRNLSLIESAICFVKKLKFPELILFGVTKISELNEILNSWNSKINLEKDIDYSIYKWKNNNDLDPRKWII